MGIFRLCPEDSRRRCRQLWINTASFRGHGFGRQFRHKHRLASQRKGTAASGRDVLSSSLCFCLERFRASGVAVIKVACKHPRCHVGCSHGLPHWRALFMGLVSSEKASGPDSKLWSQNYNGKRFKPWTQSGIHVRISQSSGLDPESGLVYPVIPNPIRNLDSFIPSFRTQSGI